METARKKSVNNSRKKNTESNNPKLHRPGTAASMGPLYNDTSLCSIFYQHLETSTEPVQQAAWCDLQLLLIRTSQF